MLGISVTVSLVLLPLHGKGVLKHSTDFASLKGKIFLKLPTQKKCFQLLPHEVEMLLFFGDLIRAAFFLVLALTNARWKLTPDNLTGASALNLAKRELY